MNIDCFTWITIKNIQDHVLTYVTVQLCDIQVHVQIWLYRVTCVHSSYTLELVINRRAYPSNKFNDIGQILCVKNFQIQYIVLLKSSFFLPLHDKEVQDMFLSNIKKMLLLKTHSMLPNCQNIHFDKTNISQFNDI